MESLDTKVTLIPKKKESPFLFCVDEEHKEESYIYLQEFIGCPKLPLIGNYSKSDYSFGDILLLTKFQFDILAGVNKNEIKSPFSDFTPPQTITDYLNINEKLKIDNNSRSKDPFFYPKNKIKFHFIVTTHPLMNEDKKTKFSQVNLVPHPYYIGDSEIFQAGKTRRIFENPISIFETTPYQSFVSSENSKDRINFNDLCIEYSSVHLKKGALAFSPNNLRFNIDNTKPLSQFYLIICDKSKEYHSVFYYIVINDKSTKEKVESILSTNTNLKGVIEELSKAYEKTSTDMVKNLNSIFKI